MESIQGLSQSDLSKSPIGRFVCKPLSKTKLLTIMSAALSEVFLSGCQQASKKKTQASDLQTLGWPESRVNEKISLCLCSKNLIRQHVLEDAP